ncbi:MAG: hypothetical protein Q4C60_10910, partial [Eubacteriales bacterium]|nr:hypothetical protein [Eubacteriales bacterium]
FATWNLTLQDGIHSFNSPPGNSSAFRVKEDGGEDKRKPSFPSSFVVLKESTGYVQNIRRIAMRKWKKRHC